MENTLSIVSIAIIPKSVKFSQYIINDGEIHSMNNSELMDWVISILPSKREQLRELMSRFACILILPAEEKVVELDMDFNAEREKIRKQIRFDARSSKTLIKNSVILKSNYIHSSSTSSDEGLSAWREKFANLMKKVSQAKLQ